MCGGLLRCYVFAPVSVFFVTAAAGERARRKLERSDAKSEGYIWKGTSDRARLGGVMCCFHLLVNGLVMEGGGPMREQMYKIVCESMYLLQSESHTHESLETGVIHADMHV